MFTLYTSPIEVIIEKHDIDVMTCVDDSQIYIIWEDPNVSVESLEDCIDEIKSWMYDNKLLLNDSKTEVIHFKSRFPALLILQVQSSQSELVKRLFSPLSSVRNLGVMFDSDCSLASFVKQTCQSISYALYEILWQNGKIRHLLNQGSTENLVHVMVTSRLNYCNNLYHNISVGQT